MSELNKDVPLLQAFQPTETSPANVVSTVDAATVSAPATVTNTQGDITSAPPAVTDAQVVATSAPATAATTSGDAASTSVPPTATATVASETATPATATTPASPVAVATNSGALSSDGTSNALQPSGEGVLGGVLWGVDGHPEWGGSYSNLTPQQQADAVKAMGLGIYQGDINSSSTAQTQALLNATQADGLQFLANIGASPNSFTSAQQAYNESYQEGAAEGQQFGSQIKLWQLGNEMDGFAESSPANFQIAQSEIQGLTDGLKSTDPTAQTIVNSTDQPTGIQFLQQLQADGVNWDITGFHSYTQNGDVADSGDGTTLAADAALGKPIYVTEFNGWSSSDGSTGPSALPGNDQLITNSMNSIKSVAQQYDIIGANMYELLNQPEISGSEGQFGVLNADGSPTVTSNAVTAYMNSGGQVTATS